MPTIEIRVDVTGVPHSFIIIDNGAGFVQGYGFAPSTPSDPMGPGRIYSDTGHEYDFSTGPIEITNDQYNAIAEKITADIASPPYYNLPGSILFPGTVQQCAQWVTDVAQHGDVPLPFTMHRGGWNPYGQAIWTIIDSIVNTLFNAAHGWFQPRYDPLTLDLDGDGLETVGINAANPILFDHDGDGIKTGTGWVQSDDGFLVLDRNGNGTIDSGREMFGDATPLAGGGVAADGFAALAQEDTNADGRVDALDARFADLRIWRDLNQNGISEAGELSTLAAAGIVAVLTTKTEHAAVLANGNQIADKGSYLRADGTAGDLVEVTGDLADIDLAENPFYSEFTDPAPLTAEAQALPNMAGSGAVRDLQEATDDALLRYGR